MKSQLKIILICQWTSQMNSLLTNNGHSVLPLLKLEIKLTADHAGLLLLVLLCQTDIALHLTIHNIEFHTKIYFHAVLSVVLDATEVIHLLLGVSGLLLDFALETFMEITIFASHILSNHADFIAHIQLNRLQNA